MKIEVLLATGLVAAASIPLILHLHRTGSRSSAALGTVFCLLLTGTVYWQASTRQSAQATMNSRPIVDRPIEVEGRDYVQSDTCRSCHPDAYHSWRDSYHRTMTQVASREAAAASFDGVELTHSGGSYRLEERGSELWVVPIGDTSRASLSKPARVVLTTGSHRAQVFWLATGQGRRLKLFDFVFRIPEQTWLPYSSVFILPPEQVRPLADGTWNQVCINCHAAGSQPRLRPGAWADSQVAELGIACEACHGPGAEHIAANRNPMHRLQEYWSDDPDPTIVNPRRLSPARSVEVCGQCHGYTVPDSPKAIKSWQWSGSPYRPGDELAETRDIESSGRGKFWPDGMPRISGREYNGLTQSACFGEAGHETGLTCLTCHSMHQEYEDDRPAAEWASSMLFDTEKPNASCTDCHGELAAEEALVAHTHHPAESDGSLCSNCHMPFTTYGLLAAQRSHQITSPDVRTSLETGRPNACNQCHLDQTLAWAASELEAGYGIPRPEMSGDEEAIAASLLWIFRGDAGVRALMAWSLGWSSAQEATGSSWVPGPLSHLIVDPYDAVRFIAFRSLGELPGYSEFVHDYNAAPASLHEVAARVRAMADSGGLEASRGSSEKYTTHLTASVIERLLSQRDDRPLYLAE